MRFLLLSIAFKILVLTNRQLFGLIPKPTEYYPNQIELNKTDQAAAMLYWKHTKETITFEIASLKTLWILFGIFEPHSYSDVILAWNNIGNDGFGHFSDRKLVKDNNTSSMPIDKEQNWTPLLIFSHDEFIVYKFQRNIKLTCDCDSDNLKEDLNINIGLNKVIFSRPSPFNVFDIQNTIKDVLLLNENYQPFNCVSNTAKVNPQFNSTPTSSYSNFVDLMENGIYRLYWNFTSTDFIGEIHVKTKGWVGFGFSPNGDMEKSDVVIGWISNGRTNFTDRFINGTKLVIDRIQDWTLLFSTEFNGYTIFKFTRKLVLCNPDDRSIEVNSCVAFFNF